MNKAPDAFRTISEVADDLDLPQHVLRFWESRFPHIKPLKRGGGRRYYRREDIDLLRGIRRLLYGDGYTIKGVQRILREQGVRSVQRFGRGMEAVAANNQANEDRRERAAAPASAGVQNRPAPRAGAQSGPLRAADAEGPATTSAAPDALPGQPQNGAVQERPVQERPVLDPPVQDPPVPEFPVQGSPVQGSPPAVEDPSVEDPSVEISPASTGNGAGAAQDPGPQDGGLAPAAGRALAPAATTPAPVQALSARDAEMLEQALAGLDACRQLLADACSGR